MPRRVYTPKLRDWEGSGPVGTRSISAVGNESMAAAGNSPAVGKPREADESELSRQDIANPGAPMPCPFPALICKQWPDADFDWQLKISISPLCIVRHE